MRLLAFYGAYVMKQICELNDQIIHTEQIKNTLSEQNDKLVATADDATKKIANMSQRLENTIDGLDKIVSSNGWNEVQHTPDNFSATMDTLLNKINETSSTTTERATQIQEQINQCVESEKTISEQLQSNFNANTEKMNSLTESAKALDESLTNITTNVTNNFENVTKASSEYDETMHNNDKLYEVTPLQLVKAEESRLFFETNYQLDYAGGMKFGLRMFPNNELLPHRMDFCFVRWL